MAVWLITGSSRGIGRAIAEVVLEAGHRAILTARNPALVADLLARYAGQAIALPLDVRERSQAFWIVETAIERGFTPNVLVNNAGYGLVGALEELSAESILRQVETNLLGGGVDVPGGDSAPAGAGWGVHLQCVVYCGVLWV
jgi:NAD(P)-dependent dehydrogenase (short-subunit alcohol dehydrogenase family)